MKRVKEVIRIASIVMICHMLVSPLMLYADHSNNFCTKITTSFKDHETVLTAAHLQHMEDGISANDTALGNRVRTDTNAQGLGTSQKRNARTNIDAPSTAELTSAVATEADLRTGILINKLISTLTAYGLTL